MTGDNVVNTCNFANIMTLKQAANMSYCCLCGKTEKEVCIIKQILAAVITHQISLQSFVIVYDS